MSASNFPLLASRKLLDSTPAPSPRGDEHTWLSSPYLKEGTLNSDLAVILAAMVCALICALGLHSLHRCACCYRRQMRVDSSDAVAIQLSNTGLKKAVMKALPIVVYKSASMVPSGLAADCSICLAEFGEGEKVRVLPNCKHAFHMQCIDKWLTLHSSCPVCRHCLNLLGRNRKPEAAAVTQATESSNAMHVVIEGADSTQLIPPRTDITAQEATEVTTSSSLPPSLVSENQNSFDPMDNND